MALVPAIFPPALNLRLVLWLALFVFALPGQQLADFEISGSVVSSADGAPVNGALVVLRVDRPSISMGARAINGRTVGIMQAVEDQQRAITNGAGHFAFSVKQAAFARLEVTRRGFLSADAGGGATARLTVTQEEAAEPVAVKLTPTGALEGRVVNEDGDPVPGLTVEAVETRVSGGFKSTERLGSSVTDDQGEYRIWNLLPGSAYLRMAGRSGVTRVAGELPGETAAGETYGVAYYPDSPTQSGAAPLRIPPGGSLRADFTVKTRAGYAIRGSVLNLSAGARPTLRLLRQGEEMANRVTVNRAGAFEILDVAPGVYVLQAYVLAGEFMPFGAIRLVVEEGGLADVKVALNPPVDLTGTVQAPAAGQEDRAPAAVKLFLNEALDNPLPPILRLLATRGKANVEGRFTLRNLYPGLYAIQAESPSYYASAVWSGSVDVLKDGLTVGSAAPPELTIDRKSVV